MCGFYAGYWVRGSLFDIPAWNMDSKIFEEAHACALTHRKPLVPLATFDAPFASLELATVVIEHHSNRSPSSSRKKSSGKKRKDANYFASPSSQEGPKVKLIDTDERTPTRKV